MVDHWRRPHESDAEWRLRSDFITANYGRFPDNRLKCLSSCFINVECFGCRYSEPVMKLLAELSTGLPEVARHRSQVRAQFTAKLMRFVPASSDDSNNCGPNSNAKEVKEQVNVKSQSSCFDHDDMESSLSRDSATSISAGVDGISVGSPKTTGFPMSLSPCHYDLENESVEPATERLEALPRMSTSKEESFASSTASEQLRAFHQLRNAIREISMKVSSTKSSTDILQMSLDKCKFKAETKFIISTLGDNSVSVTCTLVINGVYVAVGEANNKKASKHAAYASAVEKLQKPYLYVENQLHLIGSTAPPQSVSSSKLHVGKKLPQGNSRSDLSKFVPSTETRMRPIAWQSSTSNPANRTGQGTEVTPLLRPSLKRPASDLSNFVILRSAAVKLNLNENTVTGCLSVLQQSVTFNKLSLKCDFSSIDDKSQCSVLINGQLVASAIDECKLSAQCAAVRQALNSLSRTCCTVIIKSPQDIAMNDSIKRTEVLDGKTGGNNKIPESNVGSLLLKKMGWTGGGIGKGGNEGIEEPVSLTAVINRAGLGSGVRGDFAKSVNRIVVDYLRSDREDDLVFAMEFSNEERAVIHNEARKHSQQLRSRSYGSKDARYLVLSRRRSPAELVRHIRNHGGETLKYILQEPSAGEAELQLRDC